MDERLHRVFIFVILRFRNKMCENTESKNLRFKCRSLEEATDIYESLIELIERDKANGVLLLSSFTDEILEPSSIKIKDQNKQVFAAHNF